MTLTPLMTSPRRPSGIGGLFLLAFVITLPTRSEAQTTAENPSAPPSVTVTGGVGNSMGWLGVQAERYLSNGRFSVLGGVGFLVPSNAGDTSGPAFAAGMRAFTTGARHRGFLEISLLPIMYGLACFDDCHIYYGPAVQGGYEFLRHDGLTLLASYGIGFAPGVPSGKDAVNRVILAVGLGYTWRR
jgi:hypothetical protein